MENKKKRKVEAIYPLNKLQQSILFHHLSEKNDKGFLIVQSKMDGQLDIDAFKESWVKTIDRHSILRTTVHWENIKSPVQIVNYESSANIQYLDWSEQDNQEQEKKLNELKDAKKDKGLNFQKNPLSDVIIIKIGNASYFLLWVCHHLFLDGWSSRIIIEDVFKYYQAIETNNSVNLPSIPSYKSYLKHIKQLDVDDAKSFWVNTFEGYQNQPFFGSKKVSTNILEVNYLLSQDLNNKVNLLVKTYRITLNTLFQGMWALVLSKLLNSDDITYGNTVSGRSIAFPQIDVMAGMFANVIPLRAKLTREFTVKDVLKTLLNQQTQARNYEYLSADQIAEWVNGESAHLFDCLFIFENFPRKTIKTDKLLIHSTESGITTTYPLTLVVNVEEDITLSLFYDHELFSKAVVSWMLKTFEDIITGLFAAPDQNIEHLLDSIAKIDFSTEQFSHNDQNKSSKKITRPKNKTEFELLQIWQNTLGIQEISTSDNFFELGGKSIMAVKMIAIINKKLNTGLSVIKLLEYPTIHELSDYILQDSKAEPLNHIVPIRSKGDKTPLFCIHAGGGYVFFYGHLKEYLKQNRPIYALQPSGLEPDEDMHESVEAMAKDYIKAIRDIQPKGPYNILVYCFSTTVGHEMSILLEKENEMVNFIVVDSLATNSGGTGDITLLTRIDFFLKRLVSSPIKSIKNFFNERKYLIEPIIVKLFGTDAEKQLVKVQANLGKLSNAYKFMPRNGNVSLILTDKVDKRFEDNHIQSWKKVTKGEVNVLYTNGKHAKLFEKPDVEFVSEQIDLTMKD
ncbi:condensation domain-containing protein [Winogradskyella sp.]|uniref:condensation domain-containing protein n=1 Tax=Winogradskyella sp. TaxID=1883156 RepID=UPI003BAC6311